MIAVLYVKVPFELLVPENEKYILRTYEDSGYHITIGVPRRSEAPNPNDAPDSIFLNGKKAFYADVLQITFHRDTFNRDTKSEMDPPLHVINNAIRSFLGRLKYASKAFQIQPVELPGTPWQLTYLNDDGSPLSEQNGLLRSRSALAFRFGWIACDSALWEIIHSLPPDFHPPEWRTLLTDASGALPHVGTSVVLAATSLEVFISEVLNKLRSRSNLPENTWTWINNRKNRQNNPTVEEQYSDLLEMLCGKSLKSQDDCWEGFKNLKEVRNRFVHEGNATIGGNVVTPEQARKYIAIAEKITTIIREWIPEDLRWPIFEHLVDVKFEKKLLTPIDK